MQCSARRPHSVLTLELSGPKIKTHGDMLAGKPFDVVPHSPLVAGQASKVSLVGFTDAGASACLGQGKGDA